MMQLLLEAKLSLSHHLKLTQQSPYQPHTHNVLHLVCVELLLW